MIQSLSARYRPCIAWPLFILFYLQLIAPLHAAEKMYTQNNEYNKAIGFINVRQSTHNQFPDKSIGDLSKGKSLDVASRNQFQLPQNKLAVNTPDIGGPSSREASNFKAVGADKLVNLFTGDFSYSIPLLDVGGYPVNLFYTGGITMEQEASWVGLGWNINPGTVNRNMRGVPDDFNGTDSLIQTQNVKPNKTWGGEIGVDGEIIGIKKPSLGLSLGFSYNNYLGPALDVGATLSLSIATIENIKYEKSATADLGLKAVLGAKLSSRSGLTFSPSLNANLQLLDKSMSLGVGLSTSYNSRIGIKDITLSSQTSFYDEQNNNKEGDAFKSHTETTSGTIGSSTFSFARPSYLPSLRMPMENANTSGQIELGGGIFGFRGSATANGYYSESKVAPESRIMAKPLVGFMYSELAGKNKDAVMDFNRLNDGEVTPNTPLISAPQYAYDIFSIQGEGTGGSIRAYRGDLGFMRDNVNVSKDKNISLGADIAPPGHYGVNWNIINSPTRVGGWEDGNNTLLHTLAFKAGTPGITFENVYFKNPGEATVTNNEVLSRIGDDNLVRFKLSGFSGTPRLESALEMFNKKSGVSKGILSLVSNTDLQNREKRTQVTTMLTATEASVIGLEKYIRNYSGAFDTSNNIVFDNIPRISSFRKAHHISEIDVLEQNGMRYVYGIPVYSIKQKDFTFSVENIPANNFENLVAFDTATEPTINSKHMMGDSKIDGYLQVQETPAYASSFLLTGLLSPDYVDVTGNGITEDDLGGAVKFNYTKSSEIHKWRTPRKNTSPGSQGLAHFNEGICTEQKDNKATISYGEREAWYLNSIESRSMIAIFKTSQRNDARGVKSEMDGSVNTNENANKKLSRIDLYTKAEIKSKGIINARPLKSVIFEYGYGLCKGSPDNLNGGKLTLQSIYFTYNGQIRNNKGRYVFNYGDTILTNSSDDPSYNYNSSDRWGIYKNAAYNPYSLSNIAFPYTDTSKTKNDNYASAWSLKKILLPSGGQVEVKYEADDYAYVQNRRACNMFGIYGIGRTSNYVFDSAMYNGLNTATDNLYVYIKLPVALENTNPVKRKQEIYQKYLEGINQLAFKLMIEMPKGPEPLTVYANFDDFDICPNAGNTTIIYLKLRPVDGKSPLALSAIGFLTGNLPGQAFPGYETSISNLSDFIDLASDMIGTLKEVFKNVDGQMRSSPKARSIVLSTSFVRLNNPTRIKCGGGARVKQVLLKDNWNKMTGQYGSVYGQDYEYTKVENSGGKDIIISSGVASYEPGIGSEENPFREIESFKNKLPMASAQFGAIEMPVLEALYPSPCVGYSNVTVRSIHRKGTHGNLTVRSGIGKQVTEFFTARDFPAISSYTPMASADYNKNPFFSFFYKEIINRRTISQGFLVETNDMHGKMRSQSAYSESDEKTPISAAYYTYKNTGKNGLNDKVDFVYNDQGGVVKKGNMGIDMELMTDVREFKLESRGLNGQAQVDLFPFAFVILSVVTLFPLKTYQENLYRAATCTKLINYHAIEDSVIIMDKGSVISTKTILYDAETGSPVVTQTANEFNDPVYNIVYPAYWAYSGTALAYKNIGTNFLGVDFYDGRIISGADSSLFESGDELYITVPGIATTGCINTLQNVSKLWAIDTGKNSSALTVPMKKLLFIDSVGRPYSRSGVGFKIVRSGFRNNITLTAGNATCMKSPIQNGRFIINNSANVVSASAVDYKEKWQVDNDVIKTKLTTYNPVTCSSIETDDCNGYPEKMINPYCKGLIGNVKPYRSYTYYGSRNDSNVNINTVIRKNGYLFNFINFWNFNALNNLVPDYTNPKWVWNSEVTRINARGNETETRDALDRYTFIQYGFNKNLATAVVQNSRNGEAAYDGLEDSYYAESIYQPTLQNCKGYFDLVGTGKIINTDTSATLRAHSGKYMLGVNAGAQAAKPLKVLPVNNNSFNIGFGRDTAKGLSVVGGNYIFNSLGGSYSSADKSFFGTSAFTVDVYPASTTFHSYDISCSTFIRITTQGTYNFSISLSTFYNNYTTSNYTNLIGVQIYDEDNRLINSFNTGKTIDSINKTASYSVILCPGIYKISANIIERYAAAIPSNSHNFYSCQCTNCQSPDYKIISPQTTCIATKPIAATDSMLNTSFNLVPGKKMQFSAWVLENCDSVVCYKSTYINNHVELQFPGTGTPPVIIKPTGLIIDGWQKIEGEFITPLNATTASLVFGNDGGQPVYFDDIRIHPFNANMKSYVYDAASMRLSAELDENNFAMFYEYDEEGQMARVKKETMQGIKTISETRSAKQRLITDVQ
ncbi:MAG: hypothetical protein ABIN94_17330 [Ferruginibacter sp.]